MDIRVDDLSGPEIIRLLRTHLESMALLSPPDSVHALDLEALRKPEVTFAPARSLYSGFGFQPCAPFAEGCRLAAAGRRCFRPAACVRGLTPGRS